MISTYDFKYFLLTEEELNQKMSEEISWNRRPEGATYLSFEFSGYREKWD